MPMNIIPKDLKMKLTYFIKLEHVEVTETNYEFILMCGDLSTNPIEDLKAFNENVREPIIFTIP